MKMYSTLTETLGALLLQMLPAHLIVETRLALHYFIRRSQEIGIATANHIIRHQ